MLTYSNREITTIEAGKGCTNFLTRRRKIASEFLFIVRHNSTLFGFKEAVWTNSPVYSYWTNRERCFVKTRIFHPAPFRECTRKHDIENEYNFKTVLQKIFFLPARPRSGEHWTLPTIITLCKCVRIEKRSERRDSREIWLLTDIIRAEDRVYYIHSGAVCVCVCVCV